MANSEEYNGWSNYETWRVHLEMFDGWDNSDGWESVTDLADHMKEQAEVIITSQCVKNETNSRFINYAEAYALAFLEKVNWVEIAKKYWVEPKPEPVSYSQRFDYTDLGYGVQLRIRAYFDERTILMQGDDASQFLDEVANIDEKWQNGEIDIDENLKQIDQLIENYF